MNKILKTLALLVVSFVGVPAVTLVILQWERLYSKFFFWIMPTTTWPNGDLFYPSVAIMTTFFSIAAFVMMEIEYVL